MNFFLTSLFLVLIQVAFSQTGRQVLPEACMQPFYHGIASGDPMEDRVIIWTRVTPEDGAMTSVPVKWKVSLDSAMTQVVQFGEFITNEDRDYTVKVDVTGLQADTWYYYQFEAFQKNSTQGRTRTSPSPTQLKDSLRFAVVSCSNLEAGFFNSYASLAARTDFDAVLCLGDYIYEYETGGYSPNAQTERYFEPTHEIVSLEDYRMRYSIYKLDPDLRRLHQISPWFCIWDDHESANDAWEFGAENHNSGEGNWNDRKNAAKQAYFEWLPIRENSEGSYDIYRSASYGQLADLIFLDTRLVGRNEQVSVGSSSLNSASRTMLGSTQYNWLTNELNQSTAAYKLVAQQVMMAPLEIFGVPVNMDQWDGYPVERQQLLINILSHNIENVVVLTGDIHTSWASEILLNSTKVAVEFVTPSVTSPGLNLGSGVSSSAILLANNHIKWVDLLNKGFLIVDINQNRIQSDWYFVNSIDNPSTNHYHAKSFIKNNGSNQLQGTTIPTIGRNDLLMDLPQVCPRPFADDPIVDDEDDTLEEEEDEKETLEVTQKEIIVLGVYPNPVVDELTIQFSTYHETSMTLRIIDIHGKVILEDLFLCTPGSWIKKLDIHTLATGSYTLHIEGTSFSHQKKFVKN
jgi:alkaline phosphatase D